LACARTLKHAAAFQKWVPDRTDVARLFFLDLPPENPFYEKIPLLHENKILGEWYPRKQTLLPAEAISRNEMLILFGNLIRGNPLLSAKNPEPRWEKWHGSTWNASIKKLIENGLFIEPASSDREALALVTRKEMVDLAAKVFQFCEVQLGVDITPAPVKAAYNDVSGTHSSLAYLLTRGIIPFTGKKFNENGTVTRLEALNIIAGFLVAGKKI
jgi:hypothetical protein